MITADVKTTQYTDATGVVDKKWKCSYQNTTADKDVIIHKENSINGETQCGQRRKEKQISEMGLMRCHEILQRTLLASGEEARGMDGI